MAGTKKRRRKKARKFLMYQELFFDAPIERFNKKSRRLNKIKPTTETLKYEGQAISLDPVAGIDVGKESLTVAILEPLDSHDGQINTVILKKDFTNTDEGIATLLSWLRSKLVIRVIFESTSVYHQQLAKELEKSDFEVHLVNPSVVNPKTKVKTDPRDAKGLARKLLTGVVGNKRGQHRSSYLPSPPEHQIRKSSRIATQFTNDRTRCKNRIHKLVDAHSIPLKKYIGRSETEWWLLCLEAGAEEEPIDEFITRIRDDVSIHGKTRSIIVRRKEQIGVLFEQFDEKLDESDRIVLRTLTHQIRSINLAIKGLRKQIDRTARSAPKEFQNLVKIATSMVGIGKTLAPMIVAEMGDVNRFANRREVSKYTGLNPSPHSSGGSKNVLGIEKQGNKHLRRHLFNAADIASKHDDYFRNFNDRLKKQNLTYRQRMCAIARKLAVIYVSLGKKQERYDRLKNKGKRYHKSKDRPRPNR